MVLAPPRRQPRMSIGLIGSLDQVFNCGIIIPCHHLSPDRARGAVAIEYPLTSEIICDTRQRRRQEERRGLWISVFIVDCDHPGDRLKEKPTLKKTCLRSSFCWLTLHSLDFVGVFFASP